MGGPAAENSVRNVLSGHAGAVVQAGRIEGGVHMHVHARSDREPPRMVPSPTTHFTNQVRALAEADSAWAGTAEGTPLTVVFGGLGGSGRREAARRWMWVHQEEFPDGQFHADLSGGLDEDGLESTKLREFLLEIGFEPAAIPGTAEGRAAAFRSWSERKRVAVSLDKALTAKQVRMLSPGAGSSVVLVTAPGRLSGLGVREQVTHVDLEPFEDDAARELLRRIVGTERIDVEPGPVERLIEFCGGLPIALCVVGGTLLIAPRRPIARLVGELDNQRRRLALLSADEDLSVTAVFDTAYELLDDGARKVYSVLGVHPGTGGVHPDTVAAVSGLPEDEVPAAVDRLVRSGLAQEMDERLSLHTLVRLHSWERTDEAARSDLLARILDHYHAVGVAAGHAAMPLRGWRERLVPQLAEFDERAPADPMAWLTAERVNLTAVVKVAEEAGKAAYAWELALLLWPLHERGKHFGDLAAVSGLGAEAAERAGLVSVQSLLLVQKGFAAVQSGEPAEGGRLFERAEVLAQEAGHADLVATAVESQGLARLAADDLVEAEKLLRRNLALAQAIGDPRRLALARLHLGKVCGPGEAVDLLTMARAWFVEAGPVEVVNVAKVDLVLGIALTHAHEWSEAATRLASALDTMTGKPYDEAQVLCALGDLAQQQDDGAAAVEAYELALVIAETYGYTPLERALQVKLVASRQSVDGELDPGLSESE